MLSMRRVVPFKGGQMPFTPDTIVQCRQCGAKNRIPNDRSAAAAARCGRCGTPLPFMQPETEPGGSLTVRCAHCRTRNRVPMDKLERGAKCGKCGVQLQVGDILSGKPVVISDGNFEEKVMASPLPVLLYAWAPWCGTCQSTGPMIDGFAADSKGKVRVAKVNVDANPQLASRFNILSVPFLFIFDNGQLKESLPGAVSQYDLMLKMAHYF
jgi:thioredoxin 2